MIYPQSRKPPIWSIDPGVIAYNCQKVGMPHPAGAWPFWEGVGDMARDYSGHGNHGTLMNGPVWIAGGINFDGNNDNVATGESIGDVSKGGISISACVKTTSLGFSRIFNEWDGVGTGSFISLANGNGTGDGQFTVEWRDDTSADFERRGTGFYINDGNLHHLVLTLNIDTTEVVAYADGNSVLDITEADLANGFSFATENAYSFIGCNANGAYHFLGNIGNVHIFNNTALSAAQVKTLYDNPYFMYQVPEELYGYVAGAPPTGNPFWYYNMLRRRN